MLRWIEALVDSVLVRKGAGGSGQPIAEGEIDKAGRIRPEGERDERGAVRRVARGRRISLPAYRRRLRWQMERGAIVRARKFKEVTVTESEVRDYFRRAGTVPGGGAGPASTLFFPIASAQPQGEDAAQARIAVQQAAEAVRAGRTRRGAGVGSRKFPKVQPSRRP